MKQTHVERWSPWLLLVAVVALWQIICTVFSVSEFIFPSPSRIWTQMVEYKGIIAAHAWHTYWVTMAGFGLAIVVGVCWGIKWAEKYWRAGTGSYADPDLTSRNGYRAFQNSTAVMVGSLSAFQK